jgi:hypothetical protein
VVAYMESSSSFTNPPKHFSLPTCP